MQSASYVRPMTISEIYTAAFRLYGRHYRPLLVINFIYTVLVLALNYFNRPAAGTSLGFLLAVMTELVQVYIYAVMVVAASNAVLARPVRVGPAFRRPASPPVLAKLLIFSLPLPLMRLLYLAFFPLPAEPASSLPALTSYFGGSFILFGLMFAARILLLFAAPVSILEKRGILDTLRRVLRLSWQFAGANFVRYGIFFVPFQALRWIAARIFLFGGLLLAASTQFSLTGMAAFLLMQVPLGLVILFLNPLGNLVAVLLYYDARARSENYHHEVLAEEMGYQPITEWITT